MRYLRYLIILFLIIATSVALLFLPRKITISTVVCKNQYGECSSDIRSEFEKNVGLTIKQANNNISSYANKNSKIVDHKSQYIFPGQLNISIIEAKAIYAIKKDTDSEFYVIDSKGNVILMTDSTNLPILIVTNDPPKVGGKISEEEEFAGRILNNIYYTHQVESAFLEEDGIYIVLAGMKVIFPKEGDIQLLSGSLNAILAKLRNDFEKIKIGDKGQCACYIFNECRKTCTIDLRFRNPVIR